MRAATPLIGGLPIVGALPRFIRDPFSLLRRAAAKGGVCRMNLGFLDVVTLHHPDHVDHVLRKHQGIYTKDGPFWDSIRSLVGNGLPASQGAFWLRQRRLMQPQFHKRRLEAMTRSIVKAIDGALAWGDVSEDWKVLEVGGRIPRLTMNVVSSVVFGAATSQQVAHVTFEELRFAIDHMFQGMLADKLPRWIPMPGRDHFRQSAARLRAVVDRFIQRRRRYLDDGGDDLLGLMLHARDEETGEAMSDEELLDEALSLFLAGFETTANGLQWSLYFLAKNPECFARLRAEADEVLAGGLPTFNDVRRLAYARGVMQEALRINPPAWWLPRVASEDDEIDGHRIAAGTLVAPITYTIHRHPDFWPDPERFDPARFLPEQAAGRHRFAWVPFGAGPHQCIGQELALMEATMALAMFAQRYELEWADFECRPKMSTVVVPNRPVRAKIRRRPGVDAQLYTAAPVSESSSAWNL